MEIKVKDMILRVVEDCFEIETENKVWKSKKGFKSSILLKNGRHILFESAKQIERKQIENEIGCGILTRYRDLKGVNFAFDTYIWIEKSSSHVYFEWIPVNDNGLDVKEICWPSPIVCVKATTFIPYYEGRILSEEDVSLNGSYALCSKEGSKSFIAQIDEDQNGYLMLSETPWDMMYHVHNGEVCFTHTPTLGKMGYRRVLHTIFMKECAEEKINFVYENYLKEKGIYADIKEDTGNIETLKLHIDKNDYVQNEDGSFRKEVCADRLFYYIKKEVNAHSYTDLLLDYFSDALVECNHPLHRIHKKECMEKRIEILRYLTSKNITVWVNHPVEWMNPYVKIIKE